MDIEEIHIGMKLHNPHANRTGDVVRIEQEGGLVLRANGLCWNEHVENVELVGDLHIGDYVRATGKSATFEENVDGKIGIIESFMNDVDGDRCADVKWLCGSSNLVKVAQLEHFHRGDYPFIRPAIHAEDFRPLAKVAKCYITCRIDASQLLEGIWKAKWSLLSQNAKRVVEFLTAMDAPVAFYRIAEGLSGMVSGTAIIDGLIEAREAGIVRLDDGKYSIVRD